MRILIAILIAAGSLLLALYSYVNRLYTEKGRFLIRGSKDNVDFFEEQVEPMLKIGAEEAETTFPLLIELTVILLAVLVIAWDLGEPLGWTTLLQGALFLVLDVLFLSEVLPHALLARTEGKWLRPAAGLLRASILLVYPLTAVAHFLHHVSALGDDEEAGVSEPTASENIEALMLAGEEEGLLEKDDRKLIRSVVEFGDKKVRDVMRPRHEIFAVPADTTLAQLKQMLATHRLSRIPVYQGDIDHILGFVHAHDLLPVTEKDLAQTTVRKLLRPVTFVPETKPVSELLKEIQQRTRIAIVVDEYGSVAGLVTVEDMVEEIVGEIRDEHETPDVIPQEKGAYSVPGSMDLGHLQELFGVRIEDPGEATTVSGLVTGAMGKVPSPGEIMERDGLVFHVTEADGRRIVRLRIGPAADGSAVGVRSAAPVQDTGKEPGQP
jgi:CBS domain containing-hemolysin-like protein